MDVKVAIIKLQAFVRMILIRRLYRSVFEEFFNTVFEIRLLLPVGRKSSSTSVTQPVPNEFQSYTLEKLLDEEKNLETMILERIRILEMR